MDDRPGDHDVLDELAEEFLARQRRGESPSIEQYAADHPEIAEEIRELFPAMAAMEQLKARGERTSGGSASLGPVKIERLGDFRIIREIGRGGMGVVFEAEQQSLGRRVALKVLPRQALLERRHLARFKREARLASRLHHTNIVQVYGVGEQDGFHYYVMQYVQGTGLDKVVARLGGKVPARSSQGLMSLGFEKTAQSRGDGPPSGSPSLKKDAPSDGATLADAPTEIISIVDPKVDYFRRVARIGVQVAEALAYAHGQGTLHRDVKPSNILLDDGGSAWLTDFGLARGTAGPDVTVPGDLTGTLRYMPPERFRGQVDARGDVYGLGLTLYELITGRCGFEDEDRSTLLARISESSPPAPRRVNPAVPRDLDTVVLKAIAREPGARYASAGALADDLRRFIEDRPILARRVGAGERLWRWCRRNPAVASLSAATILLIVAVATVASVSYVRTAAALKGESLQRQRAENVAEVAREAIDKVFERLGSFRPDISASLSIGDANDASVEIPRPAVASKESAALLEEMLPFYDRLAEQTGEDAPLAVRAADAKRRIGDIRQRLGQYDKATAAYTSALDAYERLAETGQSDPNRMLLARASTYNELGRTYRMERKDDEAGQSHREVLRLLGEGTGASPAARFELAKAYYYLGCHVPADPGTRPPAADPGGRGPGGRPGRGQDDRGRLEAVPGRGMGGPRRGGGFGGPGPGRGAGGRQPTSDQFDPDADTRRPGGWRKGPGRGVNGGPGPEQRRLAPQPPAPEPLDRRKRESLDKAAAILKQLAADRPDNAEYRHWLALCYREQARGGDRSAASQPATDTAEDKTGVDRAIEILELLVKQHPEVPEYRFDLSETYAMVEAIPPARRGPGPRFRALNAIEYHSLVKQRLERALELSRQLTSEHPSVPEYRVSRAHICQKLGQLLLRTRRPDRAEQLDRQSVEIQDALVREFPDVVTYRVWLAVFRNALADALLARPGYTRNAAEARTLAETNLAEMNALLSAHPDMWYLHKLLADANDTLAVSLRAQGEDTKADEVETEARRHREALTPPDKTPGS